MVSDEVSLNRIEGRVQSTSAAGVPLDDANTIVFAAVPLFSPNGDRLVQVAPHAPHAHATRTHVVAADGETEPHGRCARARHRI
jgi:hypothetical protein